MLFALWPGRLWPQPSVRNDARRRQITRTLRCKAFDDSSETQACDLDEWLAAQRIPFTSHGPLSPQNPGACTATLYELDGSKVLAVTRTGQVNVTALSGFYHTDHGCASLETDCERGLLHPP